MRGGATCIVRHYLELYHCNIIVATTHFYNLQVQCIAYLPFSRAVTFCLEHVLCSCHGTCNTAGQYVIEVQLYYWQYVVIVSCISQNRPLSEDATSLPWLPPPDIISDARYRAVLFFACLRASDSFCQRLCSSRCRTIVLLLPFESPRMRFFLST